MNESIAMFELCNVNVTRCVRQWKMVPHAKCNQLHGNDDGGVFVRNVWNICEKLNRQLWFCVARTIERLLKFLLVDFNMPRALQYILKGLLKTSWKNRKGTHFRCKKNTHHESNNADNILRKEWQFRLSCCMFNVRKIIPFIRRLACTSLFFFSPVSSKQCNESGAIWIR